ncbi:MAG: hypothetical protein HZC42_06900 [Candidatus Eisenbacteria bacterium]|nr:hypothetical protein [Candidatus Eisenbacteria bacterium]
MTEPRLELVEDPERIVPIKALIGLGILVAALLLMQHVRLSALEAAEREYRQLLERLAGRADGTPIIVLTNPGAPPAPGPEHGAPAPPSPN